MAKSKLAIKFIALTVMSTLLFSACSKKLPKETLPTTIFTEAPIEEFEPEDGVLDLFEIEPMEIEVVETEPEVTEPEPLHGPFSTAVVTDKAFDTNGKLSIKDGTIVNEAGEAVQLRGISSYDLQYEGDFLNEAAIMTLAQDWGCTVIRLSISPVNEDEDLDDETVEEATEETTEESVDEDVAETEETEVTEVTEETEESTEETTEETTDETEAGDTETAEETEDVEETEEEVSDSDKHFQMLCDCIDLCVEQGVYCIVDWQIPNDGDPMSHKDEALDFFTKLSEKYAECPNVIYEIYNEPNGTCFENEEESVSWDKCIKPYAEEIIPAIRANSPDCIVIVGTPDSCKAIDEVLSAPVAGYENIMYALHFNAATDGQENRDLVDSVLETGLPVFCTSWTTTDESGSEEVNTDASDEWIAYMKEHNISWCNYSIGSSNSELCNAIDFQSEVLNDEEKFIGHWPDEFITDSGYYVRTQILEIPYEPAE